MGDVTVKVETVDTLGTDESGFAIAVPTTSESGVVSMVYKYLKITPSVDLTGNLKSAKIKFEVDHQWLIDNGVDASDVVLLHFKDGVWTELPTSFDGDDGKISNFEAITTGFSYFAISVKKSQQVITPPVCAQVITSAQSPAGACAKFPTPCDVPTGWKVVSQCQSVTVVTTPTTVPQQPPVQKVEGGMTKNEQLALFLGIIVVALLVVWLFVYHRAPPKDKFFESRFKNHPVPHNRGWKKERPPMNWRY